ncbi:hypothetical protein [Anaerosinus gibii]|uniref:Replication initiation factor domain-containing protein n=1 Tax=Selenobaculum gibii TaxID=3054208 RepID=A0A9Y2AKK5_9FIRM|nr:hypothetical protein [Selenobaculum gbiensis]WIW71473.1 hypothetical protein P3F81_03975 [Selenobaculum gbiensis]
MHSSIGIHTANIFKKTTWKESTSLYDDFKKFENETKELRTRPLHINEISSDSDECIKRLYAGLPKYYRMEYARKDKGIRWEMRRNKISPGYIKKENGEDKPCSIKAKITPKVLNGENDYVAAATEDIFRDVENSFNIEAERISPLLGNFDLFSYNRIDYCFNGDTQELKVGCTAEQMMKLIKRANIPSSFTERAKYNKRSNRKKPEKHSFYLKTKGNSVVINCYWKGAQLAEEYPDNPSLEDSRHVIRFEVQCKYPKVHLMSSNIKRRAGDSDLMIMKEMWSDKVCEDVVTKYFNKVVRKGDYFTLAGARWMVEAYNFRQDKEERLIYALELINECRGIAKAKSKLLGIDLQDFKRSLKDLDDILVNPVTIPREWNIDYIPNLLWAYYDSIYDEQLITLKELKAKKYVSEYLTRHWS